MQCCVDPYICGGTYYQDNGAIDFPLGNVPYRNNERCEWNVRLPDSGERISVNVTDMWIENHSTCGYDSLEVSI